MTRSPLFRFLFVATIASTVAAACFYSVPGVLPIEPEASPSIDSSTPPRDVNQPPRIDSSLPDAGCTNCATVLLEGNGVATAFFLDQNSKRAFLAIRNGATSTLVEFDSNAATAQMTPIVSSAASITAIGGPTGSSIVYQAGTEILRVTPPQAPTPIVLSADGGTFTLTSLATGIDSSGGNVFALGTFAGGPELRSVAVATGVTNVLTTVPVGTIGHRFIDPAGALYWLEPSGSLAALGRVAVNNPTVARSGIQYLPVLGVRNDTPYVASTTQFLRLTGSSVSSGTPVGAHTGTPTLLAVTDDLSGGAPNWVQGPPNVVRYATSTTASATLAPIMINGTAGTIAFLAGSDARVFIVANAANRYQVSRY